jgi:hypothetical protein
MSLLGDVVKMDVDKYDKASGAFLRAQIRIELMKPTHRGLLLCMSRTEEPRWFDANTRRFLCFGLSCGVIGHLELECKMLTPRNM